MDEKTFIVVVDDHPLFRDGLENTLRAEPDFEITGTGASAEDALRLCEELLPDMLLLDINIPGGGLNVLPRLGAACPVTQVVMLTASEEEDDVLAALKGGARGYILKGVSARELIRILRGIRDGEPYVTPTLAASLLSDMTSAPGAAPADPLAQLTERERQILEQVASGQSNKEIAYQFHLSEKTVKHHMTNILQKLHARNRVEAALLARQGARR